MSESTTAFPFHLKPSIRSQAQILVPPADRPDQAKKNEEVEVNQDEKDDPVMRIVLVDGRFEKEEEEANGSSHPLSS